MSGQSNGIPDGVNDLRDEAARRVDEVSAEISELGRELRQTADEARKGMIRALNEGALNLRQGAREAGAPKEVVGAVDDVAKGFERAANYLNAHTVDEIRKDAEDTIRQNSTTLLVIMLIVGVVIGLLLRGGDRKK